jgi:hypothetical protein
LEPLAPPPPARDELPVVVAEEPEEEKKKKKEPAPGYCGIARVENPEVDAFFSNGPAPAPVEMKPGATFTLGKTRNRVPLDTEEEIAERIAKSAADFVFVNNDKPLEDNDTIILGETRYDLPKGEIPTEEELRAHSAALLANGVSWEEADKQLKTIRRQIRNYKAKVKRRQAAKKKGLKGNLEVLAEAAAKAVEKEEKEDKKKKKKKKGGAVVSAPPLPKEVSLAPLPKAGTRRTSAEQEEEEIKQNVVRRGEGATYETDPNDKDKKIWVENPGEEVSTDRTLARRGVSKFRAVYDEYAPQWNSFWSAQKEINKISSDMRSNPTFWTSHDWFGIQSKDLADFDFRVLTERTLELWLTRYARQIKDGSLKERDTEEWINKERVPWDDMMKEEKRKHQGKPNAWHVERLSQIATIDDSGRPSPFQSMMDTWEVELKKAFLVIVFGKNEWMTKRSIDASTQALNIAKQVGEFFGQTYGARVMRLLSQRRREMLKEAGIAPWYGSNPLRPVEYTEKLAESARAVHEKYSDDQLSALFAHKEGWPLEKLNEMNVRLVYVRGNSKEIGKDGKERVHPIPPLTFVWVFSDAVENEPGYYERKQPLTEEEKTALVPYNKLKDNARTQARFRAGALSFLQPDAPGREGLAHDDVLRTSFLRDVDMLPMDRLVDIQGNTWNQLVPLRRRPGAVRDEVARDALVLYDDTRRAERTSSGVPEPPVELVPLKSMWEIIQEKYATSKKKKKNELPVVVEVVDEEPKKEAVPEVEPTEPASPPPKRPRKRPASIPTDVLEPMEKVGGSPEEERAAPSEKRIPIEEAAPLVLDRVTPDEKAVGEVLVRRGIKRRPEAVPVERLVEEEIIPPAPPSASAPVVDEPPGAPLEPLFVSSHDTSVVPPSLDDDEAEPLLEPIVLPPLKRRPGVASSPPAPAATVSPVSSIGLEEPLLDSLEEGKEEDESPISSPPSPEESPVAMIPAPLPPLKRRAGGSVLPVTAVTEENPGHKIISKHALPRRPRREPSPSLDDAFMEEAPVVPPPPPAIRRRPGAAAVPLSVRRAIANGAEIVSPHRPHEPEPYRKRSDSFSPSNVYVASDGKVRPHTVAPALKAFSNPQLEVEKRNYKRKMDDLMMMNRSGGRR